MLDIQNLSAGREGRQILNNINLHLPPNTVTALIGKNGCGKSTLCECINNTLKYSGDIFFQEKSLAKLPAEDRAKHISFLPQKTELAHIPISELVAFGRKPYRSVFSSLTANDLHLINLALEKLHIEHLKDNFLDRISGGERQKAYLAMMLAQDTEVMVLDEPTTHMDIAAEHSFIKMLADLGHNEKKTVLIVMHDINTAIKYADRIAVMDDGQIVFCGDTRTCIECGVIEKVFGVRKTTESDNPFFSI